jgi:hypothetical protein
MRGWGFFPGALPGQQQAFLALCRKKGLEPGPWLTEGRPEEVVRGLGPGDVLVVPGPEALGPDAASASWAYFQALAAGAQVVDLAGQELAAHIVSMGADPRGGQVREAMARRAVRGQVLGRPPFGYRIGPQRRLEVNPQEGEVVRLIFRLYVRQRLGLRRLVQHLNSLGLPTRTGRAWTVAAVRDVLRNRAYVGTYRRFGVRVPASHPSLVSHEEFQQAQERLQQGSKGRLRQSSGDTFALAGMAFCAYCGGSMVGVRRRQVWRRHDGTPQEGLYRYYQCGSRLNRSMCDYHTWRADELEREVVQALLQGTAQPGTRPLHAEAQQERLRRSLRRLLQMVARGDISLEEWRQEGIELVTQAEIPLASQEARSLLASWDSLSPADRRRVLLTLVERVEVWDDHVEVVARP